MIYLLAAVVLAAVLAGVAVRRVALAAVDDVRAAKRMVARLQTRIAALPPEADEDRARLAARLADLERVEAAFRARGRPALAGWRRPLTLGLKLDDDA